MCYAFDCQLQGTAMHGALHGERGKHDGYLNVCVNWFVLLSSSSVVSKEVAAHRLADDSGYNRDFLG